jgi:3-deoxy-D-manno-octulosonic acid (KDO) 8-phosphate synthase
MADGLYLRPNLILEVSAPRAPVRMGQALPVAFMVGPCQLESRAQAQEMSADIRETTDRLCARVIYNTSFDRAPSDGPNMAPLNELEELMRQIMAIDKLVKSFISPRGGRLRSAR